MATNPASEVIQHLRRTALRRAGEEVTDGQLLEDYLAGRDEAALAALVHRHGPMVWGVCRRVLPNYHDAEDSFQATFLVFVRRAASITSRELLANWLYGVARQTALKARATAARRETREGPMTEIPEPAPARQPLWQDLQPHFDEALSRLPDKYRAVMVLCELEGKTRREAARQIGVPEGTVAGRLARAKVMLAKRLAPHVLGVSAGGLALLLSQNAAPAAVPGQVLTWTIKAASLFAAGPAAAGVVPVQVAALTEGVLKSMTRTKLNAAVAGLLMVTVLGGSAGLIALRTTAAEPAARLTEPARDGRKGRPDKEALQAKWSASCVEIDGTDYTAQKAKSWLLVFADDKVKGMTKGGDELVYKLDPKKEPKEFDLMGEKDEVTRRGIYELDGNTLKMCWLQDGTRRPTEFSSTKGVLVVYEKKKE